MSAPRASDEVKKEARRLYEEEGWSGKEIGRRLGIHHATAPRWAKQEGWVRPVGMVRTHVPSDEELEEARRRAAKASEEARLRWANRRAEEANAAGNAAVSAREKMLEYVEGDKPEKARQLVAVYGVLIDKAQLLTGEATGRVELPSGEQTTDPQKMVDAGKERAEKLRVVRES